MSLEHGLDPDKNSWPSSTCSLSGWSFFEFVLFCLVIWWISYFFLLIAWNQSKDWNCRFLTVIHGSYVSYMALCEIFFQSKEMEFHGGSLTENQKSYLSIMTSYFLFDLSWMLILGNEALIIIIHHIVSLLLLLKIINSDIGGTWISYGVFGLEVTNPYLQARWFLRTYGYNNKPIHTAVELWFFVSFFFIRVILGTVYIYYLEIQPNSDPFLKILFRTIFLVSLVLVWEICRFVTKKYIIPRNQVNSFVQPVVSVYTPNDYNSVMSRVESTTNTEDEANVKNVDSFWNSKNESF